MAEPPVRDLGSCAKYALAQHEGVVVWDNSLQEWPPVLVYYIKAGDFAKGAQTWFYCSENDNNFPSWHWGCDPPPWWNSINRLKEAEAYMEILCK